jgi:hypothetical protein
MMMLYHRDHKAKVFPDFQAAIDAIKEGWVEAPHLVNMPFEKEEKDKAKDKKAEVK